jgi:2-C-methyl-D-erythritol 2,4-cyclodiphosphate synthase
MMKIRTGIGYDVHILASGRPLTLGGIVIPHFLGTMGHSDGDALIHAICDALLGAANLRDIGFHFPDSSKAYEGIDSKILLKDVMVLLKEKGWQIGNIDSIIILQKPKIKDYIPKMKEVLAKTLQIEIDDVSIKATTTEQLGFIGKEKGVAAYASVLITKNLSSK